MRTWNPAKWMVASAVSLVIGIAALSLKAKGQDSSLEPEFSTDDQKACSYTPVNSTGGTVECKTTSTTCRTVMDCIRH